MTWLSSELGLSGSTLASFGWGYRFEKDDFTCPMRDSDGNIVGMRTRSKQGSKRAVYGTNGSSLFYVPEAINSDTLIVCEGPTDAAAIWESGFKNVVGLPSCNTGFKAVTELVTRLGNRRIVMTPDRDEPARIGFSRLGTMLLANGIRPTGLSVLVPPEGFKDVRQWHKKSPDNLAELLGQCLENTEFRDEYENCEHA